MRHSTAALIAALAALPLAACGPNECEDGQTRPCYTGDPGLVGKGVCRGGLNVCRDGAWSTKCEGEELPAAEVCDTLDNDCDGLADEEVRNACGGCEALEAAPGDPCTGCGKWACDGQERLKCVPPAHELDTACEKDGCDGSWKCSATGELECRALRKNECGACGGPQVSGLGTACTGVNGCEGNLRCNALGTAAVCIAANRNNCGVCGANNVPDVESACNGPDGCEGAYECGDDGLSKVCVAPTKNECGLCGGPSLPDKGKDCGGTGVCAGKLGCNAAGDGLTCVIGNGEACTGDNGCEGRITCNESGEATVCQFPAKNACGTCGGPAVTGIGDDCTVFEGCDGKLECNAGGTGTTCKPLQTCIPPLPATDHVVISELAGAGGSSPSQSQNEFVELYNPTSAEVDISDWRLWYAAANGTPTIVGTIPANTHLASHGYYLIGGAGYSGGVTADVSMTQSANMAHSSGGQVYLTKTSARPTSPTSTNVVDMVGYGSANKREGSGTAPAPDVASIERKANATSTAASMKAGGTDEKFGNALDTNDNKADFLVRAARDPQNSASPTEP